MLSEIHSIHDNIANLAAIFFLLVILENITQYHHRAYISVINIEFILFIIIDY